MPPLTNTSWSPRLVAAISVSRTMYCRGSCAENRTETWTHSLERSAFGTSLERDELFRTYRKGRPRPLPVAPTFCSDLPIGIFRDPKGHEGGASPGWCHKASRALRCIHSRYLSKRESDPTNRLGDSDLDERARGGTNRLCWNPCVCLTRRGESQMYSALSWY